MMSLGTHDDPKTTENQDDQNDSDYEQKDEDDNQTERDEKKIEKPQKIGEYLKQQTIGLLTRCNALNCVPLARIRDITPQGMNTMKKAILENGYTW